MTEDQSEERISKHEERSSEIIKSDEEKNEEKQGFMWYLQYVKQFMHYGILEESEKEAECLYKDIMAENFTNLKKEVDHKLKKVNEITVG